jgi:hypothetical protein
MLRVTTFALAITLALGFGLVSAEEWGDLTGKFVYDGPAPTPKPVLVDADAAVFGKLGLVDESLLVDKKTGGIANVVVYVRTKDVAIHPDYEKKAEKEKTLKFDNKGGRFVPHILPVWIEKQSICLCNSDDVPHNSNLQPFGDTPINPLLPAKGEIEHKLSVEQMIPQTVTCNIHRWMKGYVLPRSNPYMAVSAADGSFKLEKVPAGTELEFQAWHEKSGYVATPDWNRGRFKLTLKAGANDLGTVKLKPALFEK